MIWCPAAAVWVVFAGQALKSNRVGYARHRHDGGSGEAAVQRGTVVDAGRKGFSSERWEFWRRRCAAVRAVEVMEGGISDLTREWADRAWIAMG